MASSIQATHRNYFNVVTVTQSDFVTDAIKIAGLDNLGVQFPAVTSCVAMVQVAAAAEGTTPTSANFVRLRGAYSLVTSYANYPIGVGSQAITIAPEIYPWPWARIEFGVAQNSTQVISIVGKRCLS